MGFDFGDSFNPVSDVLDSASDLLQEIAEGDVAGILSSTVDLAGELMESAAPVVSTFNPYAGAALRIGGSVLDAIEDGKVTPSEMYAIGESVLKSVGLEGAIGSPLQSVAGINAIAERHVVNMLEKMINGEGISKSDVDLLSDLIDLMNLQQTERSGKGKKRGSGGAEGAGGASGGSDVGGGTSIFELFAKIFGEKMGDALQKMKDIAKVIENLDVSDKDSKDARELGKQVALFNGASLEFSFVSQNFNTAINALGEGLKSAARKQ